MKTLKFVIKLKSETSTGATDIFGLATKSNVAIKGETLTGFRRVDEALLKIRRLSRDYLQGSTFNALPRIFKSGGLEYVVPGSTLKGLFRHAFDMYALSKVEEKRRCIDELESEAEEFADDVEIRKAVESSVERIVEKREPLFSSLLKEAVKYLVARLSGLSWFGIYEGLTKLPRGVALRIVERMEGATCIESDSGPPQSLEDLALRITYRLGMGLSELVFGTSGLRSAVRFHDAVVEAQESYIRTFNQVSQKRDLHVQTTPYKVEVLPPGSSLIVVIDIHESPLVAYEEVEFVLEKAKEVISQGLIGLGRRTSVGFGRANL